MTHERSHLNARLEVQLRTVELDPDNLEAADELERIRVLLLGLDLEVQRAVA
jgi:CMP-2-keto-3-deoxyoctulosonic acid synthetase